MPALIIESACVVDLRKAILGIIAAVRLSLIIQAEKSLSVVHQYCVRAQLPSVGILYINRFSLSVLKINICML